MIPLTRTTVLLTLPCFFQRYKRGGKTGAPGDRRHGTGHQVVLPRIVALGFPLDVTCEGSSHRNFQTEIVSQDLVYRAPTPGWVTTPLGIK